MYDTTSLSMKFIIAAFVASIATLAIAQPEQDLRDSQKFPSKWSSVDSLDLPKYTGGWYETLSSRGVREEMERGCTCSQSYYKFNETKPDVIDVTNACRRFGRVYEIKGEARRPNATQYPGRLQVKLDVPYRVRRLSRLRNESDPSVYPEGNKSNYNILKVYRSESGDYAQALVGGENPKYFWLISRTPTIEDQSIYDDALETAECHGYDVDNPHYSDQSQCTFLISPQ